MTGKHSSFDLTPVALRRMAQSEIGRLNKFVLWLNPIGLLLLDFPFLCAG